MANNLIRDEHVRQLADHVTPEGAALLQEALQPTEAVLDDDIDISMTAQAFADAFIRPLQARAERAGLLFAALVAEPSASPTGAATVTAPLTVVQDQGVPDGRRLLRAQLRRWADLG